MSETPLFGDLFKALRMRLHGLWGDTINALLKQGAAFSLDATILARYIGVESDAECGDFLSGMSSSASKLQDACRESLVQSTEILNLYAFLDQKLQQFIPLSTVHRPDIDYANCHSGTTSVIHILWPKLIIDVSKRTGCIVYHIPG